MCARKLSSALPMPRRFSTVLNHLGRSAGTAGSVQVTEVVKDTTPPVMHYEPGNPDANKNGMVAYPAINPVSEMVDMMGAVRSYQLNASAVTAAKQMIQQSIDILKILVNGSSAMSNLTL